MTKDKRQLRAEAVERLRGIEPNVTTGREIVEAIVNADRNTSWDYDIQVICDLLTNNEPPEGDAVKLLRDMATKPVYRVDVPEVDVRERLSKIADMVERDYVRRDGCGPCYTCSKLSELMAENAKLQAKVDELKSRHCPHYHAHEHYCDVYETRINKLTAERDSLKCAAERDADVMEALNVRLSDAEAERDELKSRLREISRMAALPARRMTNADEEAVR